ECLGNRRHGPQGVWISAVYALNAVALRDVSSRDPNSLTGILLRSGFRSALPGSAQSPSRNRDWLADQDVVLGGPSDPQDLSGCPARRDQRAIERSTIWCSALL